MPGVGKRAIAGALLALLALALPALAQDHPLRGVALVIGQSAYSGLPRLTNPANDAAAMGELLGQLGFAVTSVADGDRASLSHDLTEFEAAAKDADVALVYYSGHGIEAGGENYLVPVDADISTPAKAGATLLPVSDLLDELARTVPVTIVLLDACRSDAFPQGTMIQPPGTAEPIAAQQTGLGELRGPAPVAKPGVPTDNLGMVIGFAASPGQPALDGVPGDRNSPYAAALLKHLAAGGYSFGDLMTMVSEEVYLKTKARQLPWVNSSLRRVLSFGRPAEEASGDEAAIKAGRRQLLLTIASAPEDARQAVETVADKTDVPLDKVYAMLKALGVDTSDPGSLSQQLTDGAQRIKKLEAENTPLDAPDAEITRLASLASQADEEGATAAALDFWNRASARAREISTSLGDDAGEQHKRLAEIYSRTGDAAFLAFDLQTAADRYSDAADEVASFDDALLNKYRRSQADALESIGQYKGDSDAFDQALQIYDQVLTYLDGQPDDDLWADTAKAFGEALWVYGDRQQTDEYLTDAQSAFEQVAKIWTRDRKPAEWAAVQTDLGNVYASLGDRQRDPQKWQEAVAAYQSSLEVWTKAEYPDDWAGTNNNIATVYRALGLYEGEAGMPELQKAVEALQAALTVWTRAENGFDWAMTLHNLGNSLGDLAKASDDDSGLATALDAYDQSLEVYTRDVAPVQWAYILNDIGATYIDMARRQEGEAQKASYRKAVDAYSLCLEVRNKQADARGWALTSYNVGLTLSDLGALLGDADTWQQAVDAFTASLEVYTEADSATDWADTEEGLGWALANLGARTRNRDLIAQGRAAMEEALRIYQNDDGAADYYGNKLDQIDEMLKAVS